MSRLFKRGVKVCGDLCCAGWRQGDFLRRGKQWRIVHLITLREDSMLRLFWEEQDFSNIFPSVLNVCVCVWHSLRFWVNPYVQAHHWLRDVGWRPAVNDTHTGAFVSIILNLWSPCTTSPCRFGPRNLKGDFAFCLIWHTSGDWRQCSDRGNTSDYRHLKSSIFAAWLHWDLRPPTTSVMKEFSWAAPNCGLPL